MYLRLTSVDRLRRLHAGRMPGSRKSAQGLTAFLVGERYRERFENLRRVRCRLRKKPFATGCSKRSRYKAPRDPRREAYLVRTSQRRASGVTQQMGFFSSLLLRREDRDAG